VSFPEPFTVASGAAALAAERCGAAGPVVVLLHAGVADRRSWRPVAAELAALATVVAYDRRGFGETAGAPEPHRHADDLLAVLDAVADGPAWLVGSSQGGRVALDLALARPDRVAGLVLVAPAISGAPEPDVDPAEQAVVDLVDAADAAGDLDALNAGEAWLWLDGPAQAEGRVGGAPRELFLDMNGRALAAPDPGPEIEPPDAMEAAGAIACPALVAWGDLDLHGLAASSAWLAAQLPAGRPEVLDGTAHLPYLEEPECFAALAGGFIRGAG
jgi:pimeloyl-ACP methyl ester carboxylesterase